MAGKVICSKCGQESDAGETFCGSCGAFLEWSAEQVAPGGPDAPPPSPGSLPGPATVPVESAHDPQPAEVRPIAVEPPPVAPVRPGPSQRSVPPGPLDVPGAAASLTSTSVAEPAVAPEPTIACPACGRANPTSRNFCHSCGARLRPRPAEPMAHRRRAGSGRDGLYRLVSIVLLIAIILVGSFLVTRLTGSSSTASPRPSPTRASVTRLVDG
jgi:hypothetical protein